MTADDLVFIAVLVPSVVLHEVSHGVAALVFGDDTARRAGRLTLNPLAHIDPFGTLLLPLLLVLAGAHPFGYAKPVPVNPNRLRNRRWQSPVVSLVGPGTNIVLCVLAAVAIRLLPFDTSRTVFETLFKFGLINVVLATFNLIPIPPLDGSAVIEPLLPRAWWPRWAELQRYSMGILLVIVLFVPSALGRVFDPAIRLWSRLLF